MKKIIAIALALMIAAIPAVSFAENKADRPGGYNEQVANKRSLASCVVQWGVDENNLPVVVNCK